MSVQHPRKIVALIRGSPRSSSVSASLDLVKRHLTRKTRCYEIICKDPIAKCMLFVQSCCKLASICTLTGKEQLSNAQALSRVCAL
jgi:hypothetical protein